MPLVVPVGGTTIIDNTTYYNTPAARGGLGVGGVIPTNRSRRLVRTVRRQASPAQSARRNACVGIIICLITSLLIYFIIKWAVTKANTPPTRIVHVRRYHPIHTNAQRNKLNIL